MMTNNFGKTSELQITAAANEKSTVLEKVYFTAPLKVMNPIYPEKGYMQIILLSASAGLMAGDTQKLNIYVKSGCQMELTSQSYEKIHKMDTGFASRHTVINIEKNSFFRYNPLPAIPFSGSAFQNHTIVRLEDKTSKLIMCDIISCGRHASGERFQYKYYKSLTDVYCDNRLIFRDNTNYGPDLLPMNHIGFFENYNVLANIAIFNISLQDESFTNINTYLKSMNGITGGITRLEYNNILIKIFSNNAQILEEINDYIFHMILL